MAGSSPLFGLPQNQVWSRANTQEHVYQQHQAQMSFLMGIFPDVYGFFQNLVYSILLSPLSEDTACDFSRFQ